MMNYPKYESYKDSGIDWLGEIPSDWELAPLRKIFSFRNEKNDPVITDNILSLSIAHGVTEYSDEGRGGNKRKDDLSAYKIARPNDIVINSMNVIVGAVGLSKYFGAISPVYYAMYVRNRSYSEYFYEYIFRNEGFQRGLLRLGKGILIKISDSGKMNTIRMKISQDDLKVLKLPLPSIQEQNLIAKFLDQKTTQIDEAISIKEKQIELLKEQKQIMIQNAVTKGLDPNVKMKDSGVDWIGEIPEHWEVKALKFISFLQSGETIKPENFKDAGYPVFGGNGFRGYTDKYTNDGKYALIGRQGALCGNVNYAEGKFFASEHAVVVYTLHNEDIVWLGEAIKCSNLNRLSQTAAQPGIAVSVVKNQLYPYPSLKEQHLISDFFCEINAQCEQVEIVLRQQIEKLKEYKTTLINSAVTGKIKVTPEMVGDA